MKVLKLDLKYHVPFKNYTVEVLLNFNREKGIHEALANVYEGGKKLDPMVANQLLPEFSTTAEFQRIHDLLEEYNTNPIPCD